MSIDLSADHVDSSMAASLNLLGWPEDTVLYEGEKVGDFSGGGYVAMTSSTAEAPSECWDATHFDKLYQSQWFEGCVGYWLIENNVAEDAVNKRLQEPPWVDLSADYMDPSEANNATLLGWPEDTVLYEAGEVGFSDGGYVAMTSITDKAPAKCWEAASFNKLHDPERFEGCVGYWLIDNRVAREAVNERLADPSTLPSGRSSAVSSPDAGDTEVFRSSGNNSTGPGDNTDDGDTKVYDASADVNTENTVQSGGSPSYCPACGTSLEDYSDIAFCPGCGDKIQ